MHVNGIYYEVITRFNFFLTSVYQAVMPIEHVRVVIGCPLNMLGLL